MKCTKCGFELDKNANFCSNCGTPVAYEAASEATSAKEALPDETEATVTEEAADAPEISEKTEDKATLDEELDALLEQLDQESGEKTDEATGETGKKTPVYAHLDDDDDDEDYDDFAYEERRAKRQARKARKARDKVILLVLVGVILVGAVIFVVIKSLSSSDDKKPQSSVIPSSQIVSQPQESQSVASASVTPAERSE